MKCAKAQELFSGYLEKTIQPPMGVAFEQHLAECAQCKAEYDRFHATTVVLDELPMVEPPPDMHAVIMARVQRARSEAPGRVKWLHLDWQSVFTFRVPARALAMSAAILLVLVMLVQLTPLHTITANILGGQRASQVKLEDSGFAPGPLPYGVKSGAQAKDANLDGGLSIGVLVGSSSDSGTAYTLRLGSRVQSALPVQVFLLPDGSKELTNPLYSGTVAGRASASVTMVTTQANQSHGGKLAMVTWTSEGNSYSEFVFLPSTIGRVEASKGIDMNGAGVCDVLSRLSSTYGVVILAPGDAADKTATVSVAGSSSAGEAMKQTAEQTGFELHSLGSSIFSVK